MSQQIINIGSAPNDGTGDQLRVSFDKSNQNFTELYKGAGGVAQGLWNFNATDTNTSTAPVSGRFKTNSGNYRTATQLAIHGTTIQGINRADTLRKMLAGDIIQCQDSTNSAAWCRYNLQSAPVDNGSWFQFSVALETDGGVASGDNQEIIFVFTANKYGSPGGGGAPTSAEYITSSADATLTAERVLTNTATVTWDFSTPGQAKAVASSAVVTPPTRQVFTTVGAGTYTTPSGATWLEVELAGGGGGGGGGASATAATNGNTTSFGTFSATGGGGSQSTAGGTPGVGSGAGINLSGGGGGGSSPALAGQLNGSGGAGGASFFGGGGGAGHDTTNGQTASAPGSGGGGGGIPNGAGTGSMAGFGGAAGGYCRSIINSPAATYSYVVGAAGVGAAGVSGSGSGGNGAAGIIIVTAHFGG